MQWLLHCDPHTQITRRFGGRVDVLPRQIRLQVLLPYKVRDFVFETLRLPAHVWRQEVLIRGGALPFS